MNYDNYDCRIRVAPPKATKAVRRKTAPKSRRTSRALSRTIGALAVAICSLATVASGQIIFQPLNETTSKDAKIYSSQPTSSLTSNLNVVDPDIAKFFALLQFDISSYAYPASEITSATLTLYSPGLGASGSAPVGGLVTISPILDAWRENSTDPGTDPLSTYNAFFGASPTLHFGSAVASTNVTGAGFYTWDVTNLVKSWATGGTPNNGFFIQTPAGSGADIGFADTDSSPAVSGSAPSLTIVPEPGTAVLALAGAAACFARRRRVGAH